MCSVETRDSRVSETSGSLVSTINPCCKGYCLLFPTVFLVYQTKNRSDAVVEDAFFGMLAAVGVQDVVQGDVPHEIPDAFIEVLPDAAGGAEFAAFAFFGALNAVHDGERAFHDLQYLQQGDLLRIFGQVEAAVHAAHGADETCSAQVDHQTADVFFGNLLGLGNIPDQARLFGVVHGQIDQDPQSIASFGRDFHECFLRVCCFRRLCLLWHFG